MALCDRSGRAKGAGDSTGDGGRRGKTGIETWREEMGAAEMGPDCAANRSPMEMELELKKVWKCGCGCGNGNGQGKGESGRESARSGSGRAGRSKGRVK